MEYQEYIEAKCMETYKSNSNDSSQYDNCLLVTLPRKLYAFTPEKYEVTAISLDSYSICTKNKCRAEGKSYFYITQLFLYCSFL